MNKNLLIAAQVFAGISVVTSIASMGNALFWFFNLIFVGLNIFAIYRLEKAKTDEASRNEVIGWGVYLIFSSYVVGGVLAILAATLNQTNTSGQSNIEAQLEETTRLYDQGMISKEEYDERRKKIIEKI